MDREFKLLATIHSTHDIREYYLCKDKEEVMEKVCKDGDNCSYYTYGVYEFLAGISSEELKNIITDKINN